jgi:hypothetical protein
LFFTLARVIRKALLLALEIDNGFQSAGYNLDARTTGLCRYSTKPCHEMLAAVDFFCGAASRLGSA